MADKRIAVEAKHDGQILEVVLGPPPGNIVTLGVIEEISTLLGALAGGEYPDAKVVLLSGGGKHFSYGASVEEHRPEEVGTMLPKFHRVIEQMLECKVPTLARVSGMCLGGGFELALACSMIMADETSRFGVPEIKLGLFPPPACVLLPCKTGDSLASELVLTGEMFTAGALHRAGIVNAVVPAGELDNAVGTFVSERILPKSASSLRLATRAVRKQTLDRYRRDIEDIESLYLDVLMGTADAKEGIAAFLEKRPPEWLNR